jgi:signal transduction histidine kinase
MDATDDEVPSSNSDTVRRWLRWWFGPVVEARSWLALAHLVVGALWAVVMFVSTLVALTVSFALVPVGIGLFLIVPAFGLVAAVVGVERRRASWIGREIPPRPVAVPQTADVGSAGRAWRSVTCRLTDPERWRQVAFCATYVVAAPVLLAVAVLPWQLAFGIAFGDVGDLSFTDLLAAVLAVGLVGAAPRVVVAVASASAGLVAWFLGPDDEAALRERVDELSEQRAEILAAVASERRRIERDLHDGVQQQLVAAGIDVARASSRIDADPAGARELLDAARDKLRTSIGELRVIGRGLHPAVLDDGGLDAALSAVVAGASVPITVDVTPAAGRLPDDVAAAAYYVVNEAVANILKHAGARAASVRVDTDATGTSRTVRVTVRDDGRGGADPSSGTGLAGIRARVEALDGRVRIDSPPGGPTTLEAVIPIQPVDGAAVWQPPRYEPRRG